MTVGLLLLPGIVLGVFVLLPATTRLERVFGHRRADH
jgi:hypothetical protein